MTKTYNRKDLTDEERDIVEHAHQCGLHVKKAGPHSGFAWYCFDCEAVSSGPMVHAPIPVDHKAFTVTAPSSAT